MKNLVVFLQVVVGGVIGLLYGLVLKAPLVGIFSNGMFFALSSRIDSIVLMGCVVIGAFTVFLSVMHFNPPDLFFTILYGMLVGWLSVFILSIVGLISSQPSGAVTIGILAAGAAIGILVGLVGAIVGALIGLSVVPITGIIFVFIVGIIEADEKRIRIADELAERAEEKEKQNLLQQQQRQREIEWERNRPEREQQEKRMKEQRLKELREMAVKRLARRHPTADVSNFTDIAIESEIEAIQEEENDAFDRHVEAMNRETQRQHNEFMSHESQKIADNDQKMRERAQINLDLLSQVLHKKQSIKIIHNGGGYTGYIEALDTFNVSIRHGGSIKKFSLGEISVEVS